MLHCAGKCQQSRAISRSRGVLAFAIVMVSGCYRYVPVEPAGVRPNEEVRVQITDAAADRLLREMGAYTGQLEGQLGQSGSDTLLLSINIGRDYRGMALENARQTIAFARSDVVEVRRRQLSRGRTALATAGVLAAFGLLVNSVILQEDPNPDDTEPPPPPPPSGSVVRFRIPFP